MIELSELELVVGATEAFHKSRTMRKLSAKWRAQFTGASPEAEDGRAVGLTLADFHSFMNEVGVSLCLNV